jgi:hypothetical protein
MRPLLHSRAFRPFIINWEAIAAALIQWLHRESGQWGGRRTDAAASR